MNFPEAVHKNFVVLAPTLGSSYNGRGPSGFIARTTSRSSGIQGMDFISIKMNLLLMEMSTVTFIQEGREGCGREGKGQNCCTGAREAR